MTIQTWKDQLVTEIEVAAEWRAEKALVDPGDPRIETSQQMLFDLADQVKALPSDDTSLVALWREEQELDAVTEGEAGEPAQRYHEAKEDLLRAIGFEHEPFADTGAFLGALRARADETITEYRLR
jgi:hypothetical protein